MKLVTETHLREELGDRPCDTYTVDRGTIVTPSARGYLSDHHIELVIRDGRPSETAEVPPAEVKEKERHSPKFIGPDGGCFDSKPEHLTHIHGKRLVSKKHPRIAFRGKMDSFQARIVELQCRSIELGAQALADELEEVLDFARAILSAEIMEHPLEDRPLMGLSLEELHSMSHNPRKTFGMGHVRIHYTIGPLCVGLNSLRTAVREVELAAVQAFHGDDGAVYRNDILTALNRMSSTLYVMIYRHLPRGYDKQY
ncbi:MAG: cobalamin adenosyltransferase [Dethiosulfovibrio peptidovorans]|nr:MAG: cobalamin adenosyltransferase [Dethiosulfovibrio peptidovorans]